MKEVGVDYSTFKSLVTNKGLLTQYVDNGNQYFIFAAEADISWETVVQKDGGANQTDFETNYKSTANKAFGTTKNNTGTITSLNGTVIAPVQGSSTIVFNVTGTWSATLGLQATTDGTNWFSISGYVPTSQAITSSFSVNQPVIVNCGGFYQVQLIATAFTSGTISVNWVASSGDNSLQVYSTSAQTFIVWAQLKDGVGNNITSQVNGTKQALDVGIDVAGTQIDPRLVAGAVTTNPPTYATATNQQLSLSTTGALRTEQLLSSKQYYGVSTGAFTPPSTPTDVAIITGSATKTIRVTRLELSTTQSTAGINTWFVIVRSSANSGGTSATPTIVPLDSTNNVATAVVRSYTANPSSLGSAVGTLRTSRILSDTATTVSQPAYVFDFTNSGISSGIVLRGTSQVLALNFNGATLPLGLSVACNFEWSEE